MKFSRLLVSLTLLASLLRDHHLNLAVLFKHPSLWTGDIATNLLDQIYTQQLNNAERELLLAFSVYREPVPIEGALVIITGISNAIGFAAYRFPSTVVVEHFSR